MPNKRLSEEVYLTLLKQNILFIDDDIDGPMVDRVRESLVTLEAMGSPDIEVRIFTDGGFVSAGLAIYDFLRSYNGKKVGVVHGYARSMGAVILQACDVRRCLPHATVLIHHVSTHKVSLDVLEDEERLKRLRDSMRQDQETLYAILVGRTGKSKDEVREACGKDMEMTAKEALSFGLIDEIVDFESRPIPASTA